MIESISAYINILLAMWVIILIRRNAKLQTEAANARIESRLVDEVEKFRRAGL